MIMFNKRNDVIVLDKHLTRFKPAPKDTRPKIINKTNEIKYKYSITNNKQIAPKLKCCPVCGELENITVRYESWQVNFYCNKCSFNGSVEYLWMEDWEPDVKGEEVVF